MVELIYGLALIICGFIFGLEYGEDLSLRAQIVKEEYLLFSDIIDEVKILNTEYTENEIITATESIVNYQEGCNVDSLVELGTDFWQEEMREDLKFYCSNSVIGRIINRIEEIIEESK